MRKLFKEGKLFKGGNYMRKYEKEIIEIFECRNNGQTRLGHFEIHYFVRQRESDAKSQD